jgi:hypothetical protein
MWKDTCFKISMRPSESLTTASLLTGLGSEASVFQVLDLSRMDALWGLDFDSRG